LKVWAPAAVIDAIRTHLFNNQLWPDFSRIEIDGVPVVEFCPFEPAGEILLEGLTIRWTRTSHTVYSVGYLVADRHGAFLYSGDTGPTEALWELANSEPKLRAVFIETAFPNRLQRLAHISGHLTPVLLGEELAKLRLPEVAVNVMHVKPVYHAEIEQELMTLPRPCRILVGGEEFCIGGAE
jgi:cAMP phosphodiesterase